MNGVNKIPPENHIGRADGWEEILTWMEDFDGPADASASRLRKVVQQRAIDEVKKSREQPSIYAPLPKPVVPTEESGADVGAKQVKGKRDRNFCFTLNNYVKEDEEHLKKLAVRYADGTDAPAQAKYVVFGREVGEEGTPHLQGQICFASPKTFHTAKATMGPRYHLEFTKDLPRSMSYCMKDGDFVEVGTRPMEPAAKGKKGGDKEIERWDNIKDAAKRGKFDEVPSKEFVHHLKQMEHIHARELRLTRLENTFEQMEWYVGATGTGKSRQARELYPDCYVKMMNKWWDGYDRDLHHVVLLEDIDPVCADRMGHWLKTWTDHYPFTAESKGHVVNIRPRKVIVTSNYHIHECFPLSQDYEPLLRRFKVWEFKMGKPPTVVETPPPAGGFVAELLTPRNLMTAFNRPQSTPPRLLEGSPGSPNILMGRTNTLPLPSESDDEEEA